MNNSWIVYSVVIGVLFSIWPMALKMSKMSAYTGSTLFAFVSFVATLALTLWLRGAKEVTEGWNTIGVSLVVGAGMCGATGMFLFNHTAGEMRREYVPYFATGMIITQALVQGISLAYLGGMSTQKAIGFVVVSIGVWLICT